MAGTQSTQEQYGVEIDVGIEKSECQCREDRWHDLGACWFARGETSRLGGATKRSKRKDCEEGHPEPAEDLKRLRRVAHNGSDAADAQADECDI